MITLPTSPEGFLQGKRIFIPRHVQEMTESDRHFWIAERGIKDVHVPHWDGPGTNFSGLETLASMTVAGAATAPTIAPGTSILTRECLEPVAPMYFKNAGSRLWMRAYGTILSTAVITTQQLVVNVGPTYANPLTSAQMLAQNAAWTPAAAVIADWWLDLMITVRALGPSGSLIAVGTILNNITAAATFVATVLKNVAVGTAPTPVVLTGAGGLLVPLYFDIESVQGAATAGNSCTCLDYSLSSLN